MRNRRAECAAYQIHFRISPSASPSNRSTAFKLQSGRAPAGFRRSIGRAMGSRSRDRPRYQEDSRRWRGQPRRPRTRSPSRAWGRRCSPRSNPSVNLPSIGRAVEFFSNGDPVRSLAPGAVRQALPCAAQGAASLASSATARAASASSPTRRSPRVARRRCGRLELDWRGTGDRDRRPEWKSTWGRRRYDDDLPRLRRPARIFPRRGVGRPCL